MEKESSLFKLKEAWLGNGFAVYKDKKYAAVAIKAWHGVEVCGCRIIMTYTRPKRRGQGHRYYSDNMRCYQCGYNYYWW